MLYFCEKAQLVWAYFCRKLVVNISFDEVITGGSLGNNYNFVISLCTYLIYKDWISNREEVINWENKDIISFIRRNIYHYKEIYKTIPNYQEKCKLLSELLDV